MEEKKKKKTSRSIYTAAFAMRRGKYNVARKAENSSTNARFTGELK